MKHRLKRLNRQRLFRRRAKRVLTAQAALTEADRQFANALLGRMAPVNCGAALIRIGPDGDGGYLLPDTLEGVRALYSPGVAGTSGFDLEIAQRGISCHLADGSVDEPSDQHPNITFEKVMIGPELKPGYITMSGWVDLYGPQDGDLMLQMDIEGAEYEVIPEIPPSLLKRFRIIIIEVHDVVERLIFRQETLDQLLSSLERFHSICHVHANNAEPALPLNGRLVPQLLELTFLRHDYCDFRGEPVQYPHPLDSRNLDYLADIAPEHFWVDPA